MALRFSLVAVGAANLALQRVPFGSSERYQEDLAKVTDGDLQSFWRSRSREPTEMRPAWRVDEPRYGQASLLLAS